MMHEALKASRTLRKMKICLRSDLVYYRWHRDIGNFTLKLDCGECVAVWDLDEPWGPLDSLLPLLCGEF